MKNCYSCSQYFDDACLYKQQCVICLGKERDAMEKLIRENAGDCFGVVGNLEIERNVLNLRANAINYLGQGKE